MKRICNVMLNRKGFTLVELLVVIAIIGILAAVIAPNVFAAIEKGKVATLVQDLDTIKTASYLYYIDTGKFPGNVVDGEGAGFDDWNAEARANFITGAPFVFSGNNLVKPLGWNGPYLDKWPERSPFGGVYAYRYYAQGSWGHTHLRNENNDPLPANDVEMVWVRLEDFSGSANNNYVENKIKADRMRELLKDYIDPSLIYYQDTSGFGGGTVRILIRSH